MKTSKSKSQIDPFVGRYAIADFGLQGFKTENTTYPESTWPIVGFGVRIVTIFEPLNLER